MKNLWVKWTILVWLNAIIGLIFGLQYQQNHILYTLGVFSGVSVFIPFYAHLENYAEKNNHSLFIKALNSAMIIRICTQFFPILDIGAGILAVDFVNNLNLGFDFSLDDESGEVIGNTNINIDGDKLGFFGGLLLTVITGSILSIMVAVLTLIIMGFLTLKNHYSAKE